MRWAFWRSNNHGSESKEKSPEKKVVAVENEEDEYTLGTDSGWDEVTGEHPIECTAGEGKGNGGIKLKGERAAKMREVDLAQIKICKEIDSTISKLKRATGKLRAIKAAKNGEEPA